MIVICEGAGGIGRLLAREMGAEAANVVIQFADCASAGDAEATVAALKGAGARAFAVHADPREPNATDRVFSATRSRFGPTDLAVSFRREAGTVPSGRPADSPSDDGDLSRDSSLPEEARADEGGKALTVVTSAVEAVAGPYALYSSTDLAGTSWVLGPDNGPLADWLVVDGVTDQTMRKVMSIGSMSSPADLVPVVTLLCAMKL